MSNSIEKLIRVLDTSKFIEMERGQILREIQVEMPEGKEEYEPMRILGDIQENVTTVQNSFRQTIHMCSISTGGCHSGYASQEAPCQALFDQLCNYAHGLHKLAQYGLTPEGKGFFMRASGERFSLKSTWPRFDRLYVSLSKEATSSITDEADKSQGFPTFTAGMLEDMLRGYVGSDQDVARLARHLFNLKHSYGVMVSVAENISRMMTDVIKHYHDKSNIGANHWSQSLRDYVISKDFPILKELKMASRDQAPKPNPVAQSCQPYFGGQSTVYPAAGQYAQYAAAQYAMPPAAYGAYPGAYPGYPVAPGFAQF